MAAKIASDRRLLGLSRFDMKYSNGTLPHEKLTTSIELFGRESRPRVALELFDSEPGTGVVFSVLS